MRTLIAWIQGALLGAGKESIVKEITTVDEVSKVLETSEAGPLFLFKHSTTCPISASAHRRVVDFIKTAPAGTPEFHLVKVIESRPASNDIAARLNVTHQSPQLILVDKGTAVWNASHGSITADAIETALDVLG